MKYYYDTEEDEEMSAEHAFALLLDLLEKGVDL